MILNSTQVPNKILEAIFVARSEYTEQEKDMLLFICRKTIGWQKETEWLSLSYIARATKKSKSNISKAIAGLLKKRAIVLEVVGGKRIYCLNDWRWGVMQQITGGYPTHNEGLSDRQPIKDTPTKDTKQIALKREDVPFNLQETVKQMEESPRRELNIIAFFVTEKKLRPESMAQMSSVVARHIKVAKRLAAFSNSQLARTADDAEREYPGKWTLETIEKLLTK